MIKFYTPLVTAHMQASILMIPVPCPHSDAMIAEWETQAISITTDRKLYLLWDLCFLLQIELQSVLSSESD